MDYELKTLRLDKLNVPAETLRKKSTPSGNKKLRESLEKYGVMVPFVVTKLGKGEYAVWDGCRRTAQLRNLGKTGSTQIPALVVKSGTDMDSVIAQININQIRERLSDIAEAEGVRQLIQEHKFKQVEVAAFILKTPSWVSQIMRVWKLPREILKDLQSGKIAISHGIIISRYLSKPKILNMLYEAAKKGGISHPRLAALGVLAEKEGIPKAKNFKYNHHSVGEKSWVRLEPLQKGVRVSIHLENVDEKKAVVKKLLELLGEI